MSKTTSEKGKIGSNKKNRPRMNNEWIGEIIWKKIQAKNKQKKNSKKQSEINACEQKTTREKHRFLSLLRFKHRFLNLL